MVASYFVKRKVPYYKIDIPPSVVAPVRYLVCEIINNKKLMNNTLVTNNKLLEVFYFMLKKFL